jgi:hypothetical protein
MNRFSFAAKQKRVAKATEIKDRGNKALREGELTKAELLYSDALEVEKSITALWTNRAIVRIRLKKFQGIICIMIINTTCIIL